MRKKPILFFALSIFGGLIGAFLFQLLPLNKSDSSTPEFQSINYTSTETPVVSRAISFSNSNMESMNLDFVSASEISTKSVVYIKTLSETQRSSSWMDWFFGGGGGQQVISSGSGVIFSEDGFIVTNLHVVEQAIGIEVIYMNHKYLAEMVGSDPSSDIALLKIEGDKFPAIPIGSSRKLNVGEWVLAVGNPFNLTSTVTAGIVSAKGRDINIVKNQFPLESFIQTDAAINPGNSGGALVNIKGELVGINTAILSKTGSYAGYGFAVPVDIVKKLVGDLMKYGKVQKAFIGAEVSEVDFELAERLHFEGSTGVVITYVRETGAASEAELSRGDIILSIDDMPVDNKAMFDEIMSYKSPGEKIKMEIKRQKDTKTVEMLLRNEEGTTKVIRKASVFSARLGSDFEAISKVEKELYGINNGVKMTNIRAGLAKQVGISEGFIITEINDVPINTPDDAIKMLEKTRGRVVIEGMNNSGRKGYYSYIY